MYVNPEVYTGPPAESRDPNEMAVYAFLDQLGIAYLRCDHDYANTMEDCKAVEAVLGVPICKNLLLTNRQYAFARFTEEQGLLTAVNNDEQEAELFIPAPFQDKTYVNLETEEEVAVENGRLHITVKAAGSVFLEIR